MIKIKELLTPNIKRDYIHFAKDYKGLLFTIQKDTILTIWKITKPFGLQQIATVPLNGRFYKPHFQFDNNTLLLSSYRGNRITIIDFKDLNNVTALTRESNIGSRKASCIAKNILYTQISDLASEELCYEISEIPSVKNPEPIYSLVIPTNEMDNCASYAVTVENTIYWINQDTIYLMDISDSTNPKTIVNFKIGNFITGYPIKLSNSRILVLETYGDTSFSVNDFDITNKGIIRRSKALLRSHSVRAWQLVGKTLYIIHLDFIKIDNERKFRTYFSTIDVSDDATILSTKELPIIEVYGEDSSNIYWFSIVEDKLYILQGNGNIHDLNLKESKS